ncbi:MAG TPA: carboxypeptidase-like regulatory domain-containing protein, partial [Longimicrobium sp.]
MLAATLLWLALAPDTDIQGKVRATSSGDPVPYATVRVAELRRSVSTDAEGNFVIHGVPDGRWRVQASGIGYHPTEAVVRVGGGSVVRL